MVSKSPVSHTLTVEPGGNNRAMHEISISLFQHQMNDLPGIVVGQRVSKSGLAARPDIAV